MRLNVLSGVKGLINRAYKRIPANTLTWTSLLSLYAASQGLTAHNLSRPRAERLLQPLISLDDPLDSSPPINTTELDRKFADIGIDDPHARRLAYIQSRERALRRKEYSKIFHPIGMHPQALETSLSEIALNSEGIDIDRQKAIYLLHDAMAVAHSNKHNELSEIVGLALGKNVALFAQIIPGDNHDGNSIVLVRFFKRLGKSFPFQSMGRAHLESPWNVFRYPSGNHCDAEALIGLLEKQVIPHVAYMGSAGANHELYFRRPLPITEGFRVPTALAEGLSFDLFGQLVPEQDESSEKLKARMLEHFVRTIEFASGNLLNQREQ